MLKQILLQAVYVAEKRAANGKYTDFGELILEGFNNLDRGIKTGSIYKNRLEAEERSSEEIPF